MPRGFEVHPHIPADAPSFGDTADEIAAVVLAVPGVASLHGGMFGEVATYLPRRQVPGIRIGERRVEVHVSLLIDAPIQSTAAAIQHATATIIALPVDVTIEDVLPESPRRPSPTSTTRATRPARRPRTTIE